MSLSSNCLLLPLAVLSITLVMGGSGTACARVKPGSQLSKPIQSSTATPAGSQKTPAPVTKQARLGVMDRAWRRALQSSDVVFDKLVKDRALWDRTLLPVLLRGDSSGLVTPWTDSATQGTLLFEFEDEIPVAWIWRTQGEEIRYLLPPRPNQSKSTSSASTTQHPLPGAYPAGTQPTTEWENLVAILSILLETPPDVRTSGNVLPDYWQLQLPPGTESALQSAFAPLVFSKSESGEVLCEYQFGKTTRWLLVTDRDVFALTGGHRDPRITGMHSVVDLGPETSPDVLQSLHITDSEYWTQTSSTLSTL